MPIDTEARTVGAVVSYSDAANPRRVGTVEDVKVDQWGTHYGVRWADGELDYADLRQYGWNVEPPAPAPTPALSLSVYRSAGPDCTMRGISARYDDVSVVGVVDQRFESHRLSVRELEPLSEALMLPAYFERAEGERFASAPVGLVVRNMGRRVYFSLLPAERGADGVWRIIETSGKAGAVMAGGNLASTTDSRLRELLEPFVGREAPSIAALPIHDRVEPWR